MVTEARSPGTTWAALARSTAHNASPRLRSTALRRLSNAVAAHNCKAERIRRSSLSCRARSRSAFRRRRFCTWALHLRKKPTLSNMTRRASKRVTDRTWNAPVVPSSSSSVEGSLSCSLLRSSATATGGRHCATYCSSAAMSVRLLIPHRVPVAIAIAGASGQLSTGLSLTLYGLCAPRLLPRVAHSAATMFSSPHAASATEEAPARDVTRVDTSHHLTSHPGSFRERAAARHNVGQ